MKSSSRTRRFGDLTRPILETHFVWKNTTFRAPAISPKIARNAAPATKSHTPTSPNTAPATQNESHDWSASHMKRHLQCAGHLFSLGIYSLLASILSRHLFSLGIYCLSASIESIVPGHLFSLGIYSLGIYSLGIYFSWHLFPLGIYSLGIYSLGIYSLLASIL